MKFTAASSVEHFAGAPDGFTMDEAIGICSKIKQLDNQSQEKLLDMVIPQSRLFTPSSAIFDIQLHEALYKLYDQLVFPVLDKLTAMSPRDLATMYYNDNDSWTLVNDLVTKWYDNKCMPNDVGGIASTLRMRDIPMTLGQLATNVVGKTINGDTLRNAGWKVSNLSTASELCKYVLDNGVGFKRAEAFKQKWDRFNEHCKDIIVPFCKQYDKLDEVEPRTDQEILEDVDETADGVKLYAYTIFGNRLDSFRYYRHAYMCGNKDDHSDMMYCDASALLRFIGSRL